MERKQNLSRVLSGKSSLTPYALETIQAVMSCSDLYKGYATILYGKADQDSRSPPPD